MNENKSKAAHKTSATRQLRRRWFSVCIFPLRPSFGLTENRPQSPTEYSSEVSSQLDEILLDFIKRYRKIYQVQFKLNLWTIQY